MVQCDACDKWYHFECVGVNSDVANVSWSCPCGSGQDVVLTTPSNTANGHPAQENIMEFTGAPQGSSSPTAVAQKELPATLFRTNPASSTAEPLGTCAPEKVQNEDGCGGNPTTTSSKMERHFEFGGSNLSLTTQLRLKMLDETKELQQKYLEEKYRILSQEGMSPSVPNNHSGIDFNPQFQSSSQHSNFQPVANEPQFLPTPLGYGGLVQTPTAAQISARQVIPKELPSFDGNPEDWPLFISNFKNSTEIGGYSHGENLMRLQACLRGRAKELVKSKLLIPSMVPEIIQTLEMCFGRPEHILDSMVEKATKTPPLKDRLDGLIEYALVVRNICSTMEACRLEAHLNNPMLVKSLVDKLPNNQKLSWAMTTKSKQVPIVKCFSDWLYEIAAAASQVVTPATFSGKKGAVVNTHQHLSKPTCVFCKQEAHKIQNCGEFQALNLDAKWNCVKENRLCRQCLNYHKGKCFSNKKCDIGGCTFKHHPLLHNYAKDAVNNQVASVNAHNDDNKSRPLFRILPICIHAQGKTIQTFAFLDEGSSVTLMEQSLYNQLGLVGKKEPLELRWTGDTIRSEDDSVKTNMEVSGDQRDDKFTLYDVHTVRNLALPIQSLDMNDVIRNHSHLRGLPIKSYTNAKPLILIGLNNWRVAVPIKVKEGGRHEPIATKTRLGWTLQGSGPNLDSFASLNIHFCECESRFKMLHDEVKEYFALEQPREQQIMSAENQKAMQILEKTTVKRDNKYEVGLLWKESNLQLPESYQVACHRLKCLSRKFKKDPGLQQTMQTEIDKLVSKGYAREVTEAEKLMSSGRIWYLPIFVATNPNKPGKVRMVWDAAAKSNHKSLNDFLMTGPDLLTSLFNVLLEFRVGQIAISGDIAEMFHRIDVRDDDMHAQRFLWLGEHNQPVMYVMKALSFGTSCAPCIAHFVRNKNAEQFREVYPRAVKSVQAYHYMDDFIDSVDTEEEAIALATEVKAIHAAGGFHMRNWASNSSTVREKLSEDDSAKGTSFGAPDKILGMYWHSNNDVFQYNCRFTRLRRNVFQDKVVPTKREILQVLMSIFDPLGLVTHRTIGLKILLQDIWRSGIRWDDELADDLFQKWLCWLSNLPQIAALSVPRCYSTQLRGATNIQLHTFVDAGENAYAAVSYLRIQHGVSVDVCIVAAKSKVTPLKPISIPRLELQAALLGTRLAAKITSGIRLQCSESVFWSDSKTVLKWLSMDPKNFKPFVMFRVGEILESTNITQWNWVPTKTNPADYGTKVGGVDDVIWLQGPQFLQEDCDSWPKCDDLGGANNTEVRNHLLIINKVDFFTINVEYFSCWRRLYKALAYFLVYVAKLKQLATKCKIDGRICPNTWAQKAKIILYKYAQRSEYGEEFACLQDNKQIPKSSKLTALNIFLDEDGLIRAHGRAEKLSCNNPIILPKNHYVTFLVVRFYHENYHHCLHEATISRIRSVFHIPKLRVLYNTVRMKCQRCKNAACEPQPPQMAALPAARLGCFERPFTYVGIDFFGPLYATVGRRQEKRWGVLFTCLTVRAIHIEVAHSLDTSSCIMCIQNFISRRGAPKEIYTDNGTNFKSVAKLLLEEKQKLDLHQVSQKYEEIKWSFNPPAAPHMGGAWERLIRSVKTILSAMCPAYKFNDETLRCMLWEIEFMINSRPLTFIALDSAEDDPLTPNHLLLGSAGGEKPLCEQDYDLRMRWHQTQKFANQFWQRWVREYGPKLIRRSKWHSKIQPPSVGDIVVIVDDTQPRNRWPKGVITEIFPAKDGQVRSVLVKTSTSTYVRPVAKIAVLDVGKVDDGKLMDP